MAPCLRPGQGASGHCRGQCRSAWQQEAGGGPFPRRHEDSIGDFHSRYGDLQILQDSMGVYRDLSD